MKKLILISAVALLTASCSVFKKNRQETFDTADAIPLYPVATIGSADRSLSGHWYIKSVGSIQLKGIEDEEWPFVEFVPSEARFYGQDGCNVINGTYRVNDSNSLAFSQVAASMRLCPDDTLSYPIARALDSTRSFNLVTSPDGNLILTLVDATQKPVMTLRKSDIDYLNGAWQVAAINGKPVSAASARLVFDVGANTVSGNAGCNRLRGDISRNPHVSAALQLTNLSTTRMTCPDIQTESALLIALEEVAAARKTDSDRVDLLDAAGHSVVTLSRLTKADLQNE